MALVDFARNTRRRASEAGFRDAARYAATELAFRAPLRRLDAAGYRRGIPIFDREWDVLLVLDGCRADLMRGVLDGRDGEYEWDTHDSVASTSSVWLDRTFGDDRASTVGYVTGNPFSDSKVDGSNVGYLDEVWRYGWDDEVGTIRPRPLTDRAVDTWRRRDEHGIDRLIVHYMQPHYPFLGHRLGDGVDPTRIGGENGTRSAWDRLRDGERTIEEVWDAYRSNLEHVLDDVDLFRSVVDAERVVLSADHGNAIGEFGVYGHPARMPLGCLREVPWIGTTATATRAYTPSFDRPSDPVGVDSTVTDRLRSLGYA